MLNVNYRLWLQDGLMPPEEVAALSKPEPLAEFPVKMTPGGAWGSFLHAVRSRKVEDLNADVEHGHYASALCHLANISYRLGDPVSFNQKAKVLSENSEVARPFENVRANLEAVVLSNNEIRETRGRASRIGILIEADARNIRSEDNRIEGVATPVAGRRKE